jgi:hypothetical protein
LYLVSTNLCLDNLKIVTNNYKIQQGNNILRLNNSTLTINKSFIAEGSAYFFINNNEPKSYIIFNKCSKVKIIVSQFHQNYSEIKIEPNEILPNINNLPYVVDKCLKDKVVITSTAYNE